MSVFFEKDAEKPHSNKFLNNFLENILRYPRFFVSSMAGLILVLLSPLKNLLKTTKSRLVLLVFLLTFFVSLYFIIKNMVGL